MFRLRQDLANLEGQLAEARVRLAERKGPWNAHWGRQIAWLMQAAEQIRKRLPEEKP